MKAVLMVHITDKIAVVLSSKVSAHVINNLALSLDCILCIYYTVQFKKDQIKV